MENPFTIEDILPPELNGLTYHLVVNYDGVQDKAMFATCVVNKYHKDNHHQYDDKEELTQFMIYCSFLRDVIFACIDQGQKSNLYIDIERDTVYFLPLWEISRPVTRKTEPA